MINLMMRLSQSLSITPFKVMSEERRRGQIEQEIDDGTEFKCCLILLHSSVSFCYTLLSLLYQKAA